MSPKSNVRRHARKWRAKYVRWRSRAIFIAVTGSSGKSTTVGLTSHLLSGVAPVRTQVIRSYCEAHIGALQHSPPDDGFYVGEIGTWGPGTLQPAIDLIRPSVGIVTLVALEHKSAFRTIEAVAEEKQKLVEALPAKGLAILNCDDRRVAAMAARTKARVVIFGQKGGDYVISNLRCVAPGHLGLTITYRGQAFDITSNLTGVHQSLAVAAAFACAHQLDVPPALIIERIASFAPVFGRCSVHRVENGPIFIVDTIKAPYHSIQLALDMVGAFSAPRKRIVVGQLSDSSGGSSSQIYPKVYRAARSVADQVIFVGEHSHRSKAAAEDIAARLFVEKRSVHEAAQFLKETSLPGEIIFLKSSQQLHLERAMINFGVEVRCWEQTCGKMIDCYLCGSFLTPYKGLKLYKRRIFEAPRE